MQARRAPDEEPSRAAARRLSYASIGLALAEAALSIPIALGARSIALLGFGLDSLIEVGSAAAVLWGLAGVPGVQRERRERQSLQIVGGLLLALAAYVAYASISALVARTTAQPSLLGIVVLALSLVAMLWLRARKRRVAASLGSDPLAADAKQTQFCAYLSAIALSGLIANAVLGWWWADPLAAMSMIPVIVREGLEAAAGRACVHE